VKVNLYIIHRGGKPIGVTALTANHRYIGGYRLPESEIKALRVGGQFQGHEIKSIKRRPPSRRKRER